MKRVYSAASLPDAYIVFNLLRQAGIKVHVFNENAQGGMGEIPFTHAYPEVWLEQESDRVRAEKLIADYETSSDTKETERCGFCGEENPSNFQLCWHCGRTLPSH